MRPTHLLTFFLLFSDSNELFSQVTGYFSNTTYLNYQDKMGYYINANPDSVTIHCANMRKTGVAEYIVYAEAAEDYFHALSNHTDQEKKQLTLAHKKLKEISNPVRRMELETTVLNFEGSIYKHYKNYKAAVRKYIRGQQIARLLRDKTLEIRFIDTLADIKAELRKLPDALRETGQHKLAYKHSDIYPDSYEKPVCQQGDTKIDINNQITHQYYQQEIETIRNSYKTSTSVSFWISVLSLVTGCVLGLIIFKLKRDKRKIQQKILVLSETKPTEVKVKTRPKGTKSLKIDVETEQEILLKLKRLEQEHFYLRADFTLQNVARKIKTNTSYLSHVVNNNFHQTFSEYSNELKIRYVINKMESDSKYREFSTQAVAESVGYKNAVSFTKSFSKKTGLTPYQFSLKFKVGDTF